MCNCAVFPSLKNCCCCLPLRASTIVIAIIYTALSLPLLIMYATPLYLREPMEDSTYCFFYLACLTLIAHFFAGCVLIYAAIKKVYWLFGAWVWLSFYLSATLVLLAGVCTFIYIYQVTRGLIDDDIEEAITYASYALYGCMLYYAATVVNSYKKQLSEAARAAEYEQVESLPLDVI